MYLLYSATTSGFFCDGTPGRLHVQRNGECIRVRVEENISAYGKRNRE